MIAVDLLLRVNLEDIATRYLAQELLGRGDGGSCRVFPTTALVDELARRSLLLSQQRHFTPALITALAEWAAIKPVTEADLDIWHESGRVALPAVPMPPPVVNAPEGYVWVAPVQYGPGYPQAHLVPLGEQEYLAAGVCGTKMPPGGRSVSFQVGGYSARSCGPCLDKLAAMA